MPNWAMNKLVVTGAPEDLRRFAEENKALCEVEDYVRENGEVKIVREKKMVFSFHGIAPRPEVLEGTRCPNYTSRRTLDTVKRLCPEFPVMPVSDELSEQGLEQLKAIRDLFKSEYAKQVPEGNFGWLDDAPESMAQSLRALRETGYADWYSWSVDNWGVKWDVSDVTVDESAIDKGSLTIDFSTAWGSPDAWFAKVVERFPMLALNLYVGEPGMDFHVEWEGHNGVFQMVRQCTCEEMAEFWGIEDMFAPDEDEEEEAVV